MKNLDVKIKTDVVYLRNIYENCIHTSNIQ